MSSVQCRPIRPQARPRSAYRRFLTATLGPPPYATARERPTRHCRTSPDRLVRARPIMGITFPGESAEYRAARDRLLQQEIELRRTMEDVAAARRRLPPGGTVPEDYLFQGAGPDGEPTGVRLSELFAPGKDSLVIYSMMFPRDRT